MRFNALSVALFAIAATLGAVPAMAKDATRAHVTLGVTAGSLGVGPEVGVRISPVIGLRVDASIFDFSHDVGVNDITYNGKLHLESYGAKADIYPFGGGFRLSAGFRVNKNRVGVLAVPAGPVSVGDLTFTPAQIGTLSGTVRTEDFAPTLTIGYAGGVMRGLKFGIDAGVMFQGNPHINDLSSNGTLANDPTYKAEIVKEQQKINDKVDGYKFYPIAQLSLFYAL